SPRSPSRPFTPTASAVTSSFPKKLVQAHFLLRRVMTGLVVELRYTEPEILCRQSRRRPEDFVRRVPTGHYSMLIGAHHLAPFSLVSLIRQPTTSGRPDRSYIIGIWSETSRSRRTERRPAMRLAGWLSTAVRRPPPCPCAADGASMR